MSKKIATIKYIAICACILCAVICIVFLCMYTRAYFYLTQTYPGGNISTGTFDAEQLLEGEPGSAPALMLISSASPSETEEDNLSDEAENDMDAAAGTGAEGGMENAAGTEAEGGMENAAGTESGKSSDGADSTGGAAEAKAAAKTKAATGTGTKTQPGADSTGGAAQTKAAAETQPQGQSTDAGSESSGYTETVGNPDTTQDTDISYNPGEAEDPVSNQTDPDISAESIEPISSDMLSGGSPATAYVLDTADGGSTGNSESGVIPPPDVQ